MLDLYEIGSLCLGSAVLFGFRSYHVNRKAEYFRSATRVNDLKGLSELLEDKTAPHIVAVSGRVGSHSPFRSEHGGILGVFLDEMAKVVYEMRDKNQIWTSGPKEFPLQHKEVSWFLEDNTDRVDVAGARFAKGFYDNFTDFVFDDPASELVNKFVKPKGLVKILEHSCFGRILELGKPMTIVGEAVKYSDGSLLIRESWSGPFMFFDGYASLDKMISNLQSHSKTLGFISAGLAAAAILAFALPSVKKAWYLDESDNVTGKKAKSKTKHNFMGKAQRKLGQNWAAVLTVMGMMILAKAFLPNK